MFLHIIQNDLQRTPNILPHTKYCLGLFPMRVVNLRGCMRLETIYHYKYQNQQASLRTLY